MSYSLSQPDELYFVQVEMNEREIEEDVLVADKNQVHGVARAGGQARYVSPYRAAYFKKSNAACSAL